MSQTPTIKIAIDPARSDDNSFINSFTQCIDRHEFDISTFDWSWHAMRASDVVILHWPDNFFAYVSRKRTLKWTARLLALRIARRLFGTQVVWVAHNAKPHDMATSSPLTRSFIRALDGIVYLSAYSRDVVRDLYAPVSRTRELITVHGHYRTQAARPTQASPLLGDTIDLAYFGQIRRYKNVGELIHRVGELSDERVSLTVAGTRKDEGLAAEIEMAATDNPHIHLDLRDRPIPERELEATIDACHAVVLPYRDILNSGAALLALSRNRPVLAPRRGSLPELQAKAGEDWVYLYDGDLTAEILRDFLSWLAQRRVEGECDLTAFDWAPIGRSLGAFVRTLHDT